mmetsp:Transcript_4730/g.11040  ORF Transcript_4730/g.11040 Transcript_4730/m.11040 type:complete len:282 (+) Transcript_4730:1528-2373(+)
MEDADVRWDPRSRLDEDHIAGNQVYRVDLDFHPPPSRVSAHRGHQRGLLKFLHGLHLIFGLLLSIPLQESRHNDDCREDNRSHVVRLLLIAGLLLQLHSAPRGIRNLGRRLAVAAGEDDDEEDLRHDADPEQNVEDAAEQLTEKLQPLVFFSRRGDLVLPELLSKCSRLLLLEAARPFSALSIAGKLRLEDNGQFWKFHGVDNGLVVLLVIECIMGLELPVALADLLCSHNDARGADHARRSWKHAIAIGVTITRTSTVRHGEALVGRLELLRVRLLVVHA